MNNQNHLKPMVRRKNPSFSSSLLDEIYRSIDDQTIPASRGETQEDHRKTGQKMDQNEDMMLFNKVVGREKSASGEYHFPQSFRLNSCSTSSDSSFWTSSESETARSFGQSNSSHHQLKSKALKKYGDLKKSQANQPVSPGARLASFLNSLFTSGGNAKKSKNHERKYTSGNASSASSFTGSCFSKNPSSRGNLGDGMKRSVRFYPEISVNMDEDRRYQRNGRHNYDTIQARNTICREEIMENNRRARQVLRNYEKKLEDCKMMNDDEDCESCASSDLFELDNLDSVIASRQRYSEELPVYETTSLDANRAIARGLLMRITKL